MITTAHEHISGVIFHTISKSFPAKKNVDEVRPKMTKKPHLVLPEIWRRGCLISTTFLFKVITTAHARKGVSYILVLRSF